MGESHRRRSRSITPGRNDSPLFKLRSLPLAHHPTRTSTTASGVSSRISENSNTPPRHHVGGDGPVVALGESESSRPLVEYADRASTYGTQATGIIAHDGHLDGVRLP